MEQRADYSDLSQLWINRNLHLNQEYIDYHLELNNNPQLQEISFVDKLITRIFDSKIAKQLNSINQPDYRIYTRLALHFGPSLFWYLYIFTFKSNILEMFECRP